MAQPLLTLAVVRRLADVTQEDLAEAVGCVQASLSHWETGVVPLPKRTARKILRALRPAWRDEAQTGMVGAALRALTPEDLTRPWDEVLLEAASTQREEVS